MKKVFLLMAFAGIIGSASAATIQFTSSKTLAVYTTGDDKKDEKKKDKDKEKACCKKDGKACCKKKGEATKETTSNTTKK